MLFSVLDKQLISAKTKKETFTICYIDLDNFKYFNDAYGHIEGDSIIRSFYHILQKSIRESDIICRVGGDEFIIIFPNCSTSEAEQIMNRAKNDVNQSLFKTEVCVSFSHGFAEYREGLNLSINDLIEQADKAMYKTKQAVKAV